MDLSISIVSWNTRELLDQCVQSVYDTTSGIDLEVIVVDNGSSDLSVEMMREKHPDAHMIVNGCNAGFARANNQALEISRGRYFLLLNSDTIVTGEAFRMMVDYMDSHPACGACGPMLLNGNGSLQASWARIPTLWSEIRGVHDRRVKGRDLSTFTLGELGKLEPFEAGWVGGACLMARKSLIDRVGPMDEGYFMYCEETDWCWRIRSAGSSVVYIPQATVIHLGGVSSRKTPIKTIIRSERSRLRFLWRAGLLNRLLFAPFCALVAARTGVRALASILEGQSQGGPRENADAC